MGGSNGELNAQCVECGKTLPNEVKKPIKAIDTLKHNTLGCVGKPNEYFLERDGLQAQ